MLGKGRLSSSGLSLLIFLVFALLYVFSAGQRLFHQSLFPHFVYLADAFLKGQLYLVSKPPTYHDMVLVNGNWFVPFPPLPALLMLLWWPFGGPASTTWPLG